MCDQVESMSQQQTTASIPAFQRRALLGCILVAMLFLIAGCRINTDELDFTRAEPAKADLVGKWILVSKRSEEGERRSATKQELNLHGDGGFSVVGLPTSPDVKG